MSDPRSTPAPDEPRSADEFFRDAAAPVDSLLWWQLERHEALLAAQRALFGGEAAWVRLRVWVFLELMALPAARLARDALNRHFHHVREDALETVLKRLRDAGLLHWDASTQTYAITPLAQSVVAMLQPLTADAADADDDLAALLAGVAGAHQLGLLEPQRLGMLQAQLARLREEFADAMASGSEFELRRANARFERAMTLVDRASDAVKAIIEQAQASGHARLERLARDLASAQAGLLVMASQFNRALQQADRQRVTLGSTGVTTTDLRQWLQRQAGAGQLAALLGDALGAGVQPVFVAAQELVDGAEAEFERDRPRPADAAGLPTAQAAPDGRLEVLSLPPELGALQALLDGWTAEGRAAQPVAPAVLGGSYASAAYRAQLLPLLGDPQARHLKGATGDMARQPWRVRWHAEQGAIDDAFVAWMSRGDLLSESEPT
ncbi:MAG: hypothetical protein QM788_12855 [Roseateles sp.]|uniref:hypothetical protein n=1 Tax=Roseateles sp. TaxID=1971397 RepID=UPI0039E7A866